MAATPPGSGCPTASAEATPAVQATGWSLGAAAVQREVDLLVKAGARGAVAYVRDGDQVWQAAAGLADNGTAMRTGRRFRIASVTKTFTAALVLQQVAEGRLRLDDTVAGLLPGVVSSVATVSDLLRHTSGIGDYLNSGAFTAALSTRNGHLRHWTPRQLIGYAGKPGAPGSYSYSNTDYILLGLILEKITGQPYAQLLRTRLLGPLGLKDTELPTTLLPLNLAHTTEGATRVDASIFWTAGGLVSTAADVATLYRALFAGRLPAGAAMRSGGVDNHGETSGYGIFARRLDCGVQVFTHSGLIIGYGGAAMSTADGSRVVVVEVNSSMPGNAITTASHLICS